METAKADNLSLERPAQVTEFVQRYQDRCHLLLSFTTVDTIMPMHAVSVRQVVVNPNPEAGEVYEPPKAQGKVALTKVALEKLASAAGIDWIPSECRRLDDGSDPRLCVYRAVGRIREFDGSWRIGGAEREVDLRDDSDQIGKMSPAELAQARANIHQLAESKAKNRAVRAILGLKASYHPVELKKPFVALKLVPNLDASDPMVKELLVRQSLGITGALFGPPPTVPAALQEAQRELPAAEAAAPIEVAAEPAKTETEAPASDPWASMPKIAPREERIERIEKLYRQKFNRTRTQQSPNKKPLDDLTDQELELLEDALKAKPDFAEAII